MSDRDRSSPSLTDTPLKTYIGRHDDDYPLINGNGECSPFGRVEVRIGWSARVGARVTCWVGLTALLVPARHPQHPSSSARWFAPLCRIKDAGSIDPSSAPSQILYDILIYTMQINEIDRGKKKTGKS